MEPASRAVFHRFNVALFAILACLPAAIAQDPGLIGGDPEPPTFEAFMADRWSRYLVAKAENDRPTQDAICGDLKTLRSQVSGEIFENAGYLFLEAAFKDLDQGRYEIAHWQFLKAVELDPYLWPAYWGLARIKWEKDGDFGRYLVLNRKGIGVAFSWRNTYFMLDALYWLIGNLWWVVMIASGVIALLFGFKYVRPFYMTTLSAFAHGNSRPLVANILAIGLLLLPLLLGVNWFLAAGMYLVLFFPFFEPGERQVALTALLSWLLFPILAFLMTNINFARTDPNLKGSLTQYVYGNVDMHIDMLEKLQVEGELQNRKQLTIGNLQAQKGDFRSAQASFQKIPRFSDYWTLAQVNQGNIHFMAKEYQQAIDIYTKAVEKDPKLGMGWYNLSVVKAELGNHEEAQTARAQVAKVDPKLERRIKTGRLASELIVAKPDPVAGLSRIFTGSSRTQEKVEASLLDRGGVVSASLALIFALLAMIHLWLRNPSQLARSCDKCGMVYFQSDSPNSDWCSQCVSLFIKKDDLPSEAKVKKHDQTKWFSKRRSWVTGSLQFVLPGAKRILRGNPWSGVLAVVFWILLLILWFNPINQISHPSMLFLRDYTLVNNLVLAIAAVYWLIFGLLPIWQED